MSHCVSPQSFIVSFLYLQPNLPITTELLLIVPVALHVVLITELLRHA